MERRGMVNEICGEVKIKEREISGGENMERVEV